MSDLTTCNVNQSQDQLRQTFEDPPEGVLDDGNGEGIAARIPSADRIARDDTESASAYWGACRQKRLADCPGKYRELYRRAWSGNSRKAAIRAHCLECAGWSYCEVQLCTARACPLYEFRLKG